MPQRRESPEGAYEVVVERNGLRQTHTLPVISRTQHFERPPHVLLRESRVGRRGPLHRRRAARSVRGAARVARRAGRRTCVHTCRCDRRRTGLSAAAHGARLSLLYSIPDRACRAEVLARGLVVPLCNRHLRGRTRPLDERNDTDARDAGSGLARHIVPRPALTALAARPRCRQPGRSRNGRDHPLQLQAPHRRRPAPPRAMGDVQLIHLSSASTLVVGGRILRNADRSFSDFLN